MTAPNGLTIEIVFPWNDNPAIGANYHGHWRRRQSAVKAWRAEGHARALEAGVAGLRWNRAAVHYAFFLPDWRQRDEMNLIFQMKAPIDGICIDAKLLPGDDWEHLSTDGVSTCVDESNPRIVLTFRMID